MRRIVTSRGENEMDPRGRGEAQAPQAPANHRATQKPYILYLKANDGPSSTAYQLAVPIIDTIEVQDTRQLKPGEIPPFLRGVPTLLDIAKREAYPGKVCLQVLEQLSNRGSSVAGSQVAQDPYGTAVPGVDGPQGVAQTNDGYAPCDFMPSDSALYQTGRRRKEDTDSIISKLLEERGAEVPKQASNGQPSAAEMTKIMEEMKEA